LRVVGKANACKEPCLSGCRGGKEGKDLTKTPTDFTGAAELTPVDKLYPARDIPTLKVLPAKMPRSTFCEAHCFYIVAGAGGGEELNER